ncbi:arylsulfatase [Candidatus Sumerlaeota bacterium]|nr:arylsulfatase [Candidatus Sumerlaeota bacterium]
MRNILRIKVLIIAALFAVFFTLHAVLDISAAPPKRPNIILILSDDMGWSDLGCFGGEMRTPNLDSLARNGLRYTQFYNFSRCCPTRACLLTGLYSHQAGMGHMTVDWGYEGYRGDLNNRCVTIAEVLREAGYANYAIGKWHVTRYNKPSLSTHNWPLQRGFDKYYGLIWGMSSFYDPAICRGNNYYTCENEPGYKSDEFYFTDALSDNAVEFLKQHEKEAPDKPFFMYVAYTAAHFPMHALEKDIAKYKGKFDAGYDALRKQRIERLKNMGLIDPKWQPSPTDMKWEEVQNREWELRCMEVYAAMIDNMDQGIGRIMAELKRQDKFDDTLIFFLQDNGACGRDVGRKPDKNLPKNLRPLRPDELPSGAHPRQTRDGRPVRHGPDVMPGGPDSFIAYGQGWANVSNTPFRGYKRQTYEGGIATPLIAHWPKGISESRGNALVNEPAHLIDIMATLVDIAGAKYPEEYKENKIIPMQGISLVPSFEGKSLDRKEPLFWEHHGNRAIREGKWKLVADFGMPWELYDMETDRTEMNNLAEKYREKAKELEAKWDAWAARSNVAPLGAGRKEDESDEPESSENIFELKQGDELTRKKGPMVKERDVTITAEILEHGAEGVIIAQGGLAHGYSLYMKNGRIHFAIRKNDELTTIEAKESLPKAPVTVTAKIEKNGAIRIMLDNKELAFSPKGGPLAITPIDILSVGKDAGDPVGDYSGEFPFKGKLGKVKIETGSGEKQETPR